MPIAEIPVRPSASAHQPGADDDASLVTAALRGDAAAFERLMRRYNRLLYRAARGVVDSDADAQDALQDAWLAAFTRLAAFRGDAALGTWLARIALNAALDLQRRRRRSVPIDAGIDPEAEPPSEQMMAFTLPAHAAPDSLAARAETRALLEQAIESLPPMYRTVFLLRSVQEMSVEDVAQALGVSADAVKTRHLRARGLLRDAIGAQLEGGLDQAFAFDGARCDRMVAAVMAELQARRLIRPG